MHLFGHNRDHDYYFELPVKGSGIPNQLLGVRLHTMAISGLSRVRTELFQLLVIPSLYATSSTDERLVCGPSLPSRSGATAVAADPDSPSLVPRSAESDLPASTSKSAVHPADPSSACVFAWFGSPPRRRSTTQSATPRPASQTSARAHSLPSPLKPSIQR
jgi:hypothetical protein